MAGGFGFELRAAALGDYEREIAQARTRVEAAIQGALREVGGDLQAAWRMDVETSGLAKADIMAKTIRLKFFANKGLNPAVLVFSSFALLQWAFEKAKTLKSKQGRFILVPNPAVWPGGRIRRARTSVAGGEGGPSIRAARARFGELRFIPPKPGRAGLIVAEVAHSAKTGRFRKLTRESHRYNAGLTTVVVFFVVREARQPRRLRGAVLRERAERTFSGDAQRAFDRLLAQAERGPLRLAGPQS